MEVKKIIFVLSQENSLSFCSECTFQLETNVGCAVFLPSKSVFCLDCYLTFKKKASNAGFIKTNIICSSDFYKSYHCFLEEFGIWKPEDELTLLEAVEKHGFGNWEDVTFVSSKPAAIYEDHYLKFYVDNPFIFELDEFAKMRSGINRTHNFYSDTTDLNCVSSSNNCNGFSGLENGGIKEEPMDWDCSFSPSSSCKKNYSSVASKSKPHENCNCPEELKLSSRSQSKLTPLAVSAGYCPHRDEFNSYPFNNAELSLSILNDISDCTVPKAPPSKLGVLNDSNMLMNCLSFALIEDYNLCLKRRERMKKFAKDYHILYNQNAFAWLKQYQMVLNKEIVTNISRVLQFISKKDAKALLDNLKKVGDLKARLQDLKYYRMKGLQTLTEVELFKDLKHERKKKYMKGYENVVMTSTSIDLKAIQSDLKRLSVPLDIEILPGYDKLLDEEKELCSSARIIPSSYEHFKTLMITECQKANGLRLAQARRLAKICVNRTRRIYDYLLDRGLIWPPPS